MKNLTIIFGLIFIISSCQQNKDQATNKQDHIPNSDSSQVEIKNNEPKDSTLIVRENYNRINQIKNWDKIDSAEIYESTEGGMAKYYQSNGVLELIKVKNYGEGGYSFQDFYLLNNQISFVFEEIYNYNRHIIDPKFDISQTKKVDEVRYYYLDGKLFNIIAKDKENEKYLKSDKNTEKYQTEIFNKLIKIKNNGYNPKGISE